MRAPALAEVPAVEPAVIATLVADLEERPATLAIFQTGVGTAALFSSTDALGYTPRLLELLTRMTVAVRGPKPVAVLRERGVHIDRAAREPFTTHELLATIGDIAVDGKRVLVQRYGAANIELEGALLERGADVIEVTTYRWSLPTDTKPLVKLIDALERGAVDAIAITSSAQVYNLFALAERRGRSVRLRDALRGTVVASIGPVASAALRKFGVAVTVEASPPRLEQLASALEQVLPR